MREYFGSDFFPGNFVGVVAGLGVVGGKSVFVVRNVVPALVKSVDKNDHVKQVPVIKINICRQGECVSCTTEVKNNRLQVWERLLEDGLQYVAMPRCKVGERSTEGAARDARWAKAFRVPSEQRSTVFDQRERLHGQCASLRSEQRDVVLLSSDLNASGWGGPGRKVHG